MRPVRLMSIGEDCQCGYQLRRLRGTSETYFWDWLVTRDERGVLRVLDDGGQDLLVRRNLTIDDARLRVLDPVYGLEFQHDFPTEAGRIHEAALDDAERVREKYLYLARRTVEAMRGCTVLVVRHRRQTAETRMPTMWKAALEARLPDSRIFVAVASSEFEVTSEVEGGFQIALRAEPGGRWQGDDRSWEEGVRFCLAHLPEELPARSPR